VELWKKAGSWARTVATSSFSSSASADFFTKKGNPTDYGEQDIITLEAFSVEMS